MTREAEIAAGLAAVRSRIDAACAQAGRAPGSVRLLAASKYQSVEAIRHAYALGQREFGENYVQELVQKAAALAELSELRWHLIGHLQSNKAKDVLRTGAAVQTVDSLKLCAALANRAASTGQTVDVYLQVNISEEPQKGGVAVAELGALVEAARSQSSLRLLGLMAIPQASADPAPTRAAFQRLRGLADQWGLAELSMGMSDDLELAIEEGATLVRVGTALFGARPVAG
ncbi:MAG: YggS family pyridoxal phosphate-dependent enzyme [Polyangiales bacterium]